jgi:hypothetical protein
MLDFRGQTIHNQSAPANAGTKQLTPCFQPGDVAGFEREVCEGRVAQGYAVWHNAGYGKGIAAPNSPRGAEPWEANPLSKTCRASRRITCMGLFDHFKINAAENKSAAGRWRGLLQAGADLAQKRSRSRHGLSNAKRNARRPCRQARKRNRRVRPAFR